MAGACWSTTGDGGSIGAWARRLILPLLAAVAGCAGPRDDGTVASLAQAVTYSPAAVMSFDSAALWRPTAGTVSASTLRVEGAYSLAVQGGGWREIWSATMTKPAALSRTLAFELRLPPQQPNPGWYGQTQLYVDAPSAGVFHQYLGAVELTGKPLERFVTMQFAVPRWIHDALAGRPVQDLRFSVVLNVPHDATGTYRLDHLRFVGVDLCVGVDPDDGNPCTTDACEPTTGAITHEPVADGTPCLDADLCDGSEACQADVCTAGPPLAVDDGNPCTADACDPATGVTHVAVADGTPCLDADLCDGSEACQAGVCTAGTPLAVDDGNPCTADLCDPIAGVTHLAVPDGTPCADADLCNGDETCLAGDCTAGTPPVVADDNPCTADLCDPIAGVGHVPLPAGTACADADLCDGTESCDDGAVCQPGVPLPIDDGNPCTADACDPATGVTHVAVADGTPCADGDLCNGGETCQTGACAPGTPPPVDDGNACTADACDPATGVTHVAVADGTPCADADACNGAETCQGAVCAAGAPVAVDDGDPCTADACDPATGAVTHSFAAAGTACPDLDLCDGAEVCDGQGSCVAGPPLDVDDDDPGTIDTCDPLLGPVHRQSSAIDPTVATTVYAKSEWLFTGDDPIQVGVEPGTIEVRRAAVVHGRVLAADGSPLPGVEITVLGHDELGSTVTHADGRFAMAVNGGGRLTLRFVREGYLEAQRAEDVPWNDEPVLDDVVLLAPDPAVTFLDLASPEPIQVARGSVVTDEDGTRQATLLVPAGTVATMVLPDGSTAELPTMHVRLTEFTGGDRGPAAMPGELPATVAYTYALELNADEAVAAGAEQVLLSQPAALYVDNFLGFPVGTGMPKGVYDRRLAAWVPEENGVVLAIVGTTDGLADLDLDGDGMAEDPTDLEARGISTEERATLAATYPEGVTLWRVEITHFTSPVDINLPFVASSSGDPPPGPTDEGDDPEPHCPPCCDVPPSSGDDGLNDRIDSASVIECGSRVYTEAIPIAGTPYRLSYRSDRVPGYRGTKEIRVPLTGATVSPGVEKVYLGLRIAGRTYQYEFAPAPNLTYTFDWDGRDAFGREVFGPTLARVAVVHFYGASYWSVDRFGNYYVSGTPTGVPARQPTLLKRQYTRTVTYWNAPATGLGGFSLDVEHVYAPGSGRLYPGAGPARAAGVLGSVIHRFAGGGTRTDDGAPAKETEVDTGRGIAVAPDGTVYFPDGDYIHRYKVRKVTPDGLVYTVAGTTSRGYSGDGGPATAAQLSEVVDVALGADGSLYIADAGNHTVRRVAPDGIISTFAGTGVAGYDGDGLPAASSRLSTPSTVAVGPDGSVFVGQVGNPRIVRRIDPTGTMWTIGGRSSGRCRSGVAATETIVHPTSLTVGRDGVVYVADELECAHVRRIGLDGIITDVPGLGHPWFSIHGNTAVHPRDVAVADDGTVYATASGDVTSLYALRPGSDVAVRVVGEYRPYWEDGSPAASTNPEIGRLALGPDGAIYGSARSRLYRIHSGMAGLGLADHLIPSRDGAEIYHFAPEGRHLATLDAHTGEPRLVLSRDAQGRLLSLTDADGNVTRIERAADGTPQSIVAPHGQTTALTLDADGQLIAVAGPEGQQWSMTYHPGTLLATLTDPRGQTSHMTFDSRGLLVRDEDPAGGYHELSTSTDPDGHTVTRTTASGLSTTYRTERLADGSRRLVNTFPDGTQATSVTTLNGSTTTIHADGTVVTQALRPDPVWGMLTPHAVTQTVLPSGLTQTAESTRTATTATDNPTRLTSETLSSKLNGRETRTTYSGSTLTFTTRTPGNRTSTRVIDALGHTVRTQLDALPATDFAYDSEGRLTTVTQGTRVTSRTYYSTADARNGHLATLTNALGITTTFEPDALGRTLFETVAGTTTAFTWDARSNLTSVTPPGKPTHLQSYTPVNLLDTYTPPAAGLPDPSTTYEYDLSRRLTRTEQPGGVVITREYDSAGRLDLLSMPTGTIDYGYYAADCTPVPGCAPGRLATVVGPGSIGLSFGYDGPLTTGVTWAGEVTGSVTWSHDPDFRPITEAVTDGTTTSEVAFAYSTDSLLTCASPSTCATSATDALRLNYASTLPRLTGTTLGSVTDTYAYNTLSELASYTVTHGGSQVYRVVYDSAATPRDALGRVVEKVETLQGTTRTSRYEYDDLGRLIAVTEDGALAEEYEYDDNGNRLSLTTPDGTVEGTYDDQDRLLNYGNYLYTYTANGELASKTDTATGEVTTYQYDALGSLLRVDLPDGRVVEYVVDGRGRRVAKKVDGVTTKRWLYRDQLNPVAELDGAGVLTWQYVYGSKPNVPDYAIRVADGARYRIVSDQLGSVVLVVNVDDAADVLLAARYDAFGEQEVVAGSAEAVPFGFAGGRYDADTGLVRFGARDYDPETGRWTGRDGALWKAGTNMYGYSRADPVNWRDPDGRAPVSGGTGDCSYYEARCYQNGGSYYCEEAPSWCQWFGNSTWSNCVRECLQGCDAIANPSSNNYTPGYDPEKGVCDDYSSRDETPDNSMPWEPWTDFSNFACHALCYSSCGYTPTYAPPGYSR